MPSFIVTIEETGQKFRVDGAANEEEARREGELAWRKMQQQQQQQSPTDLPYQGRSGGQLSRQEREEKIAGLEEEAEGYQEPGAAKRGLATARATAGQTMVGLADVPLSVGKAITDVLGMPRSSEAIQKGRNWLEDVGSDWTRRVMEHTYGRELDPVEAEEWDKTAKAGVRRASFGGKLVAGAGAGGATLTAAKGFWGAVSASTAEGAVTGWLLSDPNATEIAERVSDRYKDMSIGAAFGATLGMIPGLYATGKNLVAKMMARNTDKEKIEAAKALQEEFGTVLTISQKTGNPLWARVEAEAAGDIAQNFFAGQANELPYGLAKALGFNLKELGPEIGAGIATNLRKFGQQTRIALNKMRGNRDDVFELQLNAADEVAGGAPIMVPEEGIAAARNVAKKVAELNGEVMLSPGVKNMVEEMADAAETGMTVKQFNRWSSFLTKLKKGEASFFGEGFEGYAAMGQRWAGQLSIGLKQAIEKGQALGPEAEDALQMVRAARTKYGEASEIISDAERQLFDVMNLEYTNGPDLVRKLARSDSDAVRESIRLIREMEGGELFVKTLNESVFEAAVDAGMVGATEKGFKTGFIDMQSFASAFGANSDKSVFWGLLDDTGRETAQRGVELVRKILNATAQSHPGGVIKATLPVDLTTAAINLVSRDPGFMSRMLAMAVSRGRGADWLFHTEQGISLLEHLADIAVGMPKTAAIRNMTALTLMAITTDGSKEAVRAQMEQQQQ